MDQVAEGEPFEGEDVELQIPGTLIATWEESIRTFEMKDAVVEIPYLSEAGDYYIRVRGLKKDKTWTIWSPPKKATVKVNTPALPEITKVIVKGSTVTVTLKKLDKHAYAYDYILGIKPEEEIIVAPFDGEITSVVDTGHAVGLTSSDGVELLIHVGVDTVKMQGDGFQVFVTEGQKVKTGEKLLKFDRDKIRKAGYSDTTAVLVTNSDDYSSVKTVAENVKQKDTVIIIEK